MSYIDSGFDIFFEKLPDDDINEITTLDQNATTQSVSADKIVGGTLQSINSRSSYNLDDDIFKVNDGLIDRVELGKISGNEYGLRIRDRDGNTLINIVGNENWIYSKTQKMQFDLDKDQARWYDETKLRILLGREKGIF